MECWSIPLIDHQSTLDQNLDQHSINTWSSEMLIKCWSSIDCRSIEHVKQHSTPDAFSQICHYQHIPLTLVKVRNTVCFLLELKRMITSYTAHTPKTVMPCSLLNILATHSTKLSSNHGHWLWFCLCRVVFVGALCDLMYAKKDAMKKKHASTSARPTTPVTASVKKHVT